MSTQDNTVDEASAATGNHAGVYLAVLQLVFTLGWTTYVIYLPKLAADVGFPPTMVIYILMMDQAIFTVTDTAMGFMADKVSRVVGKLGLIVGIMTVISCAAFVALPFVAGQGPQAKVALIVLLVIWAVTSSALRAPPLTLLGKYGARPSQPFLAALALLGYGLAGAASPYLGVVLRNTDPRVPFVIASVVLLIVTLGLSRVERGLVKVKARETRSISLDIKSLGRVPVMFIAAMVLLALGYQLHFSLNSAPFFLRFAKPADLEWLMPIFWIGFNIAMLPASAVTKRHGGVIVMGAAGVFGALAVIGTEFAGSLNMMIAAQFVAGAAWGCMLMSAVSAAMAIGDSAATGKVTGLVFSSLALATLGRMAAVAGGLQKMPEYAPLLHWAPVACWAVAGAGLLVLAASRLRRRRAAE